MNDAVKQAIVAAEDRRFWRHRGIDSAGVLRAARHNLTGGQTQGASTITQQYARIVAGLTGVSYARKTREAMLAWKLEKRYSKKEILEFYLNTVPFGRGAYGIEAAAQAYFGKTAKRTAPAVQQVTVAEAMVLARGCPALWLRRWGCAVGLSGRKWRAFGLCWTAVRPVGRREARSGPAR